MCVCVCVCVCVSRNLDIYLYIYEVCYKKSSTSPSSGKRNIAEHFFCANIQTLFMKFEKVRKFSVSVRSMPKV